MSDAGETLLADRPRESTIFGFAHADWAKFDMWKACRRNLFDLATTSDAVILVLPTYEPTPAYEIRVSGLADGDGCLLCNGPYKCEGR